MSDQLIRLLDAVHDENSFLEFVGALIADRVDEIKKDKVASAPRFGRGANGWENVRVESYLEAASAWAREANFGRAQPDGKFKENYWNQFAHFLYAGKIYE